MKHDMNVPRINLFQKPVKSSQYNVLGKGGKLKVKNPVFASSSILLCSQKQLVPQTTKLYF
jgi:hypothetical protein